MQTQSTPTKRVTIGSPTNATGGPGAGAAEGELAEPSGSARAGGVVVVQEWHGVNDYMKDQCSRFARAGFVALAPDLYHGKVVTTTEQASQMMHALDKKQAVAEIGQAVQYLARQPRCNGKVAVVGFCLGGGLTFAAARYTPGLVAAVPFYGLPDVPAEELGRTKVPLQAHFARKDDWAKPSSAEAIQAAVRAAGGSMDLFVYDAGHAFMRSTDPQVHDPASAALAWERAVAFLHQHLD